MVEKVRIDKWLWAVRIFKTRSIASEACKKGRVRIKDTNIKPSREIRMNETVDIKFPPITRSYKVLDITGKRMSAKLAVGFVKDVTAQEQLDILTATKDYGFEKRDRGTGRPTKYDRRLISKLKDK